MGKETRREDIIAKNVFSDPQAEAESLLSVIENLEKSFGQLLKTSMELAKKTPLEGFENVSKVNKALEESEENLKQLEKLQEVRIKQAKELEKVEKARLGGLAELQKQLNSLKKEQKELNNQAKKNLVTDNELAKRQSELSLQIKATTKAINEEQKALLETQVTKAKTSKLDSDRIKLEQKLAELTEEQAIENQKLKIELREVNRQNKQAAILASELTTEYEKQGVKLAQLRKTGKDLSLQLRQLEKSGKQGTAEFKNLQKQFDKTQKEANDLAEVLEEIDREFKQQTREIGRYEGATKGLRGSLQKLNSKLQDINDTLDEQEEKYGNVAKIATAGIGGVIAVIGGLVAGLNQSREGSQKLQEQINKVTSFVKVFISSLGASAEGLKDLFNELVTSFEIFGKQAQLNIAKVKNAFGGNKEEVKKLKGEISELQKKQEENAKGTEKVAKAFEGFFERVEETTKAQNAFLKSTFETEVEIQKLERSLFKLQKTQAESTNIANDDTLSFKEREKAFKNAAKANEDVAKKETKIAEARLKLARQQVSIELEAAGITANTTSEVINALDKEATARKVSQETAEGFQQALIALNQAQIEQADVAFATAEQRRKFVSDVEEKNLDILIDGFDNQKSINERIINDETQTLAKRRATLKETEKLGEESFQKQIEVIRSFSIKTTNLNDKLSDEEKKKRIEKIKAADLESLLNAKSSVELNDRIRELGLSEIFEGRQLEVVRDRRTAILDLIDANKDLTESEQESKLVRGDIEAQLKALQALQKDGADLDKELEKLEDERTQNEINNLKLNLNLQQNAINESLKKEKLSEEEKEKIKKEGSVKTLELQQELNDKLLEQQQKRLTKEKESEEKQAEEKEKRQKEEKKKQEEAAKDRIETAQETFDTISEIAQRQNENRLQSIEDQISKSEEESDRLRELAKEGSEDANENLALQQAKRAELEKERQAQIRRQQAQETVLAITQSYLANLSDGQTSTEALKNATIDTAKLKATTAIIGSFFEGTESTGTVNRPMDQNGGRLALLHNNEAVVPEKTNMKRLKAGLTIPKIDSMADDILNGRTAGQASNDELLIEVKNLNRSIQAIPTYQGSDFDSVHGVVTSIIKSKGRKLMTKRKIKGA
jgi:hypothetical protein